MNKKYLIEKLEIEDRAYYNIKDVKEVEVLDIDEVYQEAVKSGYMTITQYLKVHNLQIIKIIE